jgi:membrane protein DedA with SNARE-associated domain
VVHIVASVGVILLGLALALVLDTGNDLRIFGWLVVVIGVLGLLSRWVISAQENKRREPPPRR